MIEQTKRRVAALLNFCDDKSGTDRVDRPGGNENNVVRQYALPPDELGNRTIVGGRPELLWSEAPIEAEGDLGSGGGAQDVPGFGLAVRQAHRTRRRIVRM